MGNAGDKFRIAGFGDREKQLDDRILLIAGVKADGKTPRILPVDDDGIKVTVGSGLALPAYDSFVATYYGDTNNLHTVTYKLGDTIVAVITIEYAGGGAADNDKVTSITKE